MNTDPIITYVPGAGATELASSFNVMHSFNEEVAYAVAHGAALVGRPSLCLVKSHGIAKAMNAVISSLTAGASAPMVSIVFDDMTGKTSDHAFCAKRMLEGAGARVFSTAEDALHFSEAYQIPTFVCTDEKISLPQSKSANFYQKVPKRIALLNPLQSEWQRFRMNARKEAEENKTPFSFSLELPKLECPQNLPAHLKTTAESYEPWAIALKGCGFEWVTGDAGTSSLFGLPPHLLIDVTTYMGGSIPLAIGATLCGNRTLAITGDFSFLSTASMTLLEAYRRNISLNVVVFCNQKAAATGGQAVPIDLVKSAIPSYVSVKEFRGAPDQGFMDFFSVSSGLRVVLIVI